MSDIRNLMDKYWSNMDLLEHRQMEYLASQWMKVETRLSASMELLAKQANDLRKDGQPVTNSTLYTMERYQALLAQTQSETAKYAGLAANTISKEQAAMTQLGVANAQEMIDSTYRANGTVIADYNRLPAKAIDAMIGYAVNGSPLNRLLTESYPETAVRLTDTLIDSTARGINPRETAKLMADAMAGNLQRALTVARTEQLRAYRTAATQQMKDSGVVEGWIWRCALQDTTCIACIAMDGSLHELDEDLDDHPNGRCFRQPKIKGLNPVEATKASDWFAKQPEGTQISMMGAARYDAWKSGSFDFTAMVQGAYSPTWGTSIRLTSASDLVAGIGTNLTLRDAGVRITPTYTAAEEIIRSAKDIERSNEYYLMASMRKEVTKMLDTLRTAKLTAAQKKELRQAISIRLQSLQERDTALAAKVRQLLYVTDPAQFQVNYSSGISSATQAAAENGLALFQKLVSNSLLPKNASVNIQPIPAGKGDRAYYHDATKSVFLGRTSDPGTMAHELGHWMESVSPTVFAKAKEFLIQRTLTDKVQKLSTITGSAYKEYEKARPDDFMSPYMGKLYGSINPQHVNATDLTSMALEYFVDAPHVMAKNDPEMFTYFYNLLHGGL